MSNKYQKFTEMMQKKTHFTESEIIRLMDLHKTTMVSKEISIYIHLFI